MSRKKIIIKTVLYTLFFEFCFWLIFVFIFFYNYQKYATAYSWVSEKINVVNKKLDFTTVKDYSEDKKYEKWDDEFYNWDFWLVKYSYITKKTDTRKYETKMFTYKVNEKKIKKTILIKILKDRLLLDKYSYNYFLLVDDENLDFEFQNFINYCILLWILSSKDLDYYNNIWQESYNEIIWNINTYIKDEDYEKLAQKLSSLEESASINLETLPKNNVPDDSLLMWENFKYVLSKLYEKKYYDDIVDISKIFWIEKDLIISSIWVEQIRYMSTTRWYAKNLIKQNKFLTNFSQFSYWLWWIKINTARKIQKWVKMYDIWIYNKYFKSDEDLTDNELIAILENEKNWILYVWWLIFAIEKRWENAGFPLKNKPGVIITLYNVWNSADKVPHENPDLWWSLIDISWKQLYFWEIWHLFYHYLKYYIN